MSADSEKPNIIGVIGRNIALWQNLSVGVGRFARRSSSARASLALFGRFNQFRSPYSWITMRRALRKRRVFDFVPSCIEWKIKHTRTSTSSRTGLTQSLQSILAYLFDGASLLSMTNRRRKATKDVGHTLRQFCCGFFVTKNQAVAKCICQWFLIFLICSVKFLNRIRYSWL